MLGVSPSTAYSRREPVANPCDAEDMELARKIEEIYEKCPFYGSRRIAHEISRSGRPVNRKRVQRLMRKMGIAGVAPGPATSRPHPMHGTYPYLLDGVVADHPDHVWSSDITYLPTRFGFMYLAAVVDWYSRRILSYRLSTTVDAGFCVEALDEALRNYGSPEIFNTDQGAQFTSEAFTGLLKEHGVAISMDGRGRAFDNIFTERFWRNIKYEWLYLHSFDSVRELRQGLDSYIVFYNFRRIHQALDYKIPNEVYINEKVSYTKIRFSFRT